MIDENKNARATETDEKGIKNDDLSIENDEKDIKNDDLSIENDEKSGENAINDAQYDVQNGEKELLSVEKSSKRIKTMSMKKTILLVVAATLLIGALTAAAVLLLPSKSSVTDEKETIVNKADKFNSLEQITINNSFGEKIVLNPFMNGTELEWKIEGKQYDEVAQQNVYYLAMYCYYMQINAKLEYDESKLDEYGLKVPLTSITVKYVDEKDTRTFNIGDVYGNSEGYYMYETGVEYIYILPSFSGRYLTQRLGNLLNLPDISQAYASAQAVVLDRKGQSSIRLAYIPGELSGTMAWYMLEPEIADTNTEKVDEFFEQISGFTLSGYVAEKLGENAEKYGFADPAAQLSLFGSDGDVLKQVVVGGQNDSGEYYCVLLDQNANIKDATVYLMAEETFALFQTQAVNIASPYMLSININWIRSGSLRISGKEYALTIDRKTVYGDDGKPVLDDDGVIQTQNTYYIDGIKLDEMQFKTFYGKMLFLSIEGMVDENTEKGEELLGYTFETAVPVKNDDGQVEERKITYSGSYTRINENYAVFKGHESDKQVFTVRCRSIDAVAEAFALLLEGRLPTV